MTVAAEEEEAAPVSSPSPRHPDDPLGGRRLVLVSNREPYVRKRPRGGGEPTFERTTGGLVTALDPVMRRCGGVWVAWEPGGDPEEEIRHQVPGKGPRFTLRQVPLTTGEVRRYYYGFANRALWPLFHYSIDRCFFSESQWRQYTRINQRFAEAVLDETRPDDLLWIHDYHFCLLPQMIREQRPQGEGTIAYFLHVPFPAEEVYKVLPWRRQILEGLLGADLVGFHVDKYAADFLGCCERLAGADVDHGRRLVRWQGREVRVGGFPIGIDVKGFSELAASAETADRVARIRTGLGPAKLVLGVDRLDYSKGIPQRLQAIECLLRRYPEHRRQFTFLQIAVPSRTQVKEYRELKSEIDERVGRINGDYGDPDWQPVNYVYRSVPRRELVAYYRAAEVGLVTPLRDGMNLVSLEYCACQTEDDG
ncbi:MAG TPA: trehalose-6-phosphate synthase, partial [Thermoanaerobaculia bacterium]|nr:trehalose-6-phosphate synthase [Thermoanaerobaculia bacterium]